MILDKALMSLIAFNDLFEKAVKWQHKDGTWWTHNTAGQVVPYNAAVHGDLQAAPRHELPAGETDVRIRNLRRLAQQDEPGSEDTTAVSVPQQRERKPQPQAQPAKPPQIAAKPMPSFKPKKKDVPEYLQTMQIDARAMAEAIRQHAAGQRRTA